MNFNTQLRILNKITSWESPHLNTASSLFSESMNQLNKAKELGSLSLADKAKLIDRVNKSYANLSDTVADTFLGIEKRQASNHDSINSKLLLNQQESQLIGLLASKPKDEILRLAENDPSIAKMSAAAGGLIGLGEHDRNSLLKVIAPDEISELSHLKHIKSELEGACKALTGDDKRIVDSAQLSQSEQAQLQIINDSSI